MPPETTANGQPTATALPEPLGDRVLVRPIEEDSLSAGGVHIPDVAKEKPQRGEVVAVGSGLEVDPPDLSPVQRPGRLNVGDTVLYSKYGGVEIQLEGTAYVVLREGDVLLRFPGE